MRRQWMTDPDRNKGGDANDKRRSVNFTTAALPAIVTPDLVICKLWIDQRAGNSAVADATTGPGYRSHS
jgi:hypothetical protein